MGRRIGTAGAMFALLLAAASARAGVVLIAETAAPAGNAPAAVQKAFVDADRIRVESPALGGRILLFRKDRQVVVFLHPDKRTYAEATRAAMRKLQRQTEEADARYRQLLKDLPANREPLLDDLMRNPRSPQYMRPTVLYKKVAGENRIASWPCDQYQGTAAGRKVQDVWTATWTDLGLTDDEARVLVAYGEFYRELAGTPAPVFPVGVAGRPTERAYAGFPVRVIGTAKDGTPRVTELKEVRREDLDPALFEVPADYEPIDAYKDLTLGQ